MTEFSLPNDIFIEITSKCNMDCTFCPYGVLERPKENMNNESVFKILNELKSYVEQGLEVPPITFHCLGEPLMNRNLKDYMSFCDENGIHYWTVSNGLLFSEKRCDEIFSHTNLIKLKLSVHTICDRTFALRRMKNFDFYRYIKLVEHAVFNENRISNNITLQLDVMYDKNLENGKLFNAYNKDEFLTFCETVKEWKEKLETQYPEIKEKNQKFYRSKKKILNFDTFMIFRNLEDLPENLFEDLPDKVTWISWEVLPKLFITIKKFFYFTGKDKYLTQVLDNRGTATVSESHDFKCHMANSLVVLSNGEITFCCLDYEGELSCGNIKDITLKDALTSKVRAELQTEPDKYPYCRICLGKKNVQWSIDCQQE